MVKREKAKKNSKFLLFKVKMRNKWQNCKKSMKKIFNKENFSEIIDYFGYSLTFGIPIGLGLLGVTSGSLILIGLGIASFIWVMEQKGIKLLRSLWFR